MAILTKSGSAAMAAASMILKENTNKPVVTPYYPH